MRHCVQNIPSRRQTLFCLCSLFILINGVQSINIFDAIGGFVASGYRYVKSKMTECCDDNWIVKNTTGLKNVLKDKLYGQHLVLETVVKHIKAHVCNANPAKALALSFHGGTGTGKNYVSKIIAEHLFKEGMKSQYVHLISATKEFPHEEMINFYKDQLRNWIETNVSICDQSMFIFDEMDKLPAGLLNTIKPYLDYYEHLGNVNYRRAIFIFLSNTAGTEIINFTYNQWKNGIPRNKMKLKDIENIIVKAAMNTETQSGLWHSELIAKHLMTAFIPFLPLEKSHINTCIRDTLVQRGYFHRNQYNNIKNILVQEILTELSYFPEEEQLFSITGCKRVAEKVEYVMTN